MSTEKTVLVTGANQGIGRAIAERFAREGARVVLSGRRSAAVEAAVGELSDLGLQASPLTMDVSDSASIEAAVVELASRQINIDVLINNAAILPDGELQDMALADIEATLNTNVLGPIKLTRLVLSGMRERAYGRIVNVSSSWGAFSEGLGGPGAYGISKAALNAVTIRFAAELPDFIKVNAMHPGWVHTQMGGAGATRTTDQAADTAFWLGTLADDGPSGGFFYDRQPIGW